MVARNQRKRSRLKGGTARRRKGYYKISKNVNAVFEEWLFCGA